MKENEETLTSLCENTKVPRYLKLKSQKENKKRMSQKKIFGKIMVENVLNFQRGKKKENVRFMWIHW